MILYQKVFMQRKAALRIIFQLFLLSLTIPQASLRKKKQSRKS